MLIMTIRGWLASFFMLLPASVFFAGCEEEARATYGPMSVCTTDEQCVAWFDEDYYCGEDGFCLWSGESEGDEEIWRSDNDEEGLKTDSDEITTSADRDEEPASRDPDEDSYDIYGPPSYCDDDADCYLLGWICDLESNKCVAPGEGDNPNCTQDNECTYRYGEGWYCDDISGQCVPPGDEDYDVLYGPPSADRDEDEIEHCEYD